jgi:hypothetical protein
LFKQGTTIPNWACQIWGIDADFSSSTSKSNPKSEVVICFKKKTHPGFITSNKPQTRANPVFRLWVGEELMHELKDTFLMSFMRDIESRLRADASDSIESEIPFWEFLDIEYDQLKRTFHFTAHYTQKPSFPELFKRLIGSPMIHKIDDELADKDDEFRIYMQSWKPRKELDSEFGAENVLYTLLDTKNKLIYVGEAGRLVQRLNQTHQSIGDWDYYRYDKLPDEVLKAERVWLERMLIRNMASLFINKANLEYFDTSQYKLTNDKVDT